MHDDECYKKVMKEISFFGHLLWLAKRLDFFLLFFVVAVWKFSLQKLLK